VEVSKIVTIVGRGRNMMINIATVGDFTASANSTDVTAKIPTAGIGMQNCKNDRLELLEGSC
jgi:hypothetical protein